jgi:hypothetical protein
MKTYQIIAAFIFAAFLGTACEEVIILDLENADPRLVIDAVVDVANQKATVTLTKSNGFYDTPTLEVVENATVTLVRADGTTLDLSHNGNGIYTRQNLTIAIGEALTLIVKDAEGQSYQASAVAPHAIHIDSLGRNSPPPTTPNTGNPEVRLIVFWQDVPNVESFYRLRLLKNDTLQPDAAIVLSDLNRDGSSFSRPFFQTLSRGDTATVQLLSIDKNSFYYFNDLDGVEGPDFNATTPFNPRSLFTNDALGYFSIVYSDEITVIL